MVAAPHLESIWNGFPTSNLRLFN